MIDARAYVTNPAGNAGKIPPATRIGIAVHHSVTGQKITETATESYELDHIKAIDQYHVSVGYGGFGYHAAVFPSGRAYLCGDLDSQRAHVAKRNHELLGVVLIGDFTDHIPEGKQLAGLGAVLREFTAYLGREVPIKGHTGWALPGEGTGCPGRVAVLAFEALMQEERPSVFKRYAGAPLANPDFFKYLDVQEPISVWTKSPVPGDWDLPDEARVVWVNVYLWDWLVGGAVDVLDGDGMKAGFAAARCTSVLAIRGADEHRSITLVGAPKGQIDKLEMLGYWT